MKVVTQYFDNLSGFTDSANVAWHQVNPKTLGQQQQDVTK